MCPINIKYCLLLITLAVALSGCTDSGKPKLLMYDDGKMENKLCLYDKGHAIHFTKPRGDWAIKGVRFFAMRQGSSTGVDRRIVMTICDSSAQPISEYSVLHNLVDTSIEKWCPINVNPPILCPDDFWIIIDTNSTRESQIYIGADTNVKVSHSGMGNPGETPSGLEGVYDWMIRVELQKLTKEDLDKLTGKKPAE
jgi:hypothetical protein